MVNVVLAGGGTAGHTSPLIATAKALQERGVTVSCIGTPKGLEGRVIPEAGLELDMIPPVPLPRTVNADLFKVP
ncbi:MAG: glycosyltransferase, partial [Cutibacterium avidum]|nr:glycosyltransferase [Cutibacterium avidum]